MIRIPDEAEQGALGVRYYQAQSFMANSENYYVKLAWRAFQKAPKPTQGSVMIGLCNKLYPFFMEHARLVTTPLGQKQIEAGAQESDFLARQEPGTAIFIVIPEGDASRYKDVLATFVGQGVHAHPPRRRRGDLPVRLEAPRATVWKHKKSRNFGDTVLPRYRVTCVQDGLLAYTHYTQCRHALCGVHLLRELTYFEEVAAETRAWAGSLKELLPEMKGEVELVAARGEQRLPAERLAELVASYARLVADGLRAESPPEVPEQVRKQARTLLLRPERRKQGKGVLQAFAGGCRGVAKCQKTLGIAE